MKSKEKFSGKNPEKSFGVEKEPHIQYSREFPGGIRFEVLKAKDGELKINLGKDGGDRRDFSDFLPSGWKFVSKDYVDGLNKEKGTDIPWFGWLADHDRKMIQIGKFGSPKDLLTVLHEVGHAQKNDPEDLKKYDPNMEAHLPAGIGSKEYIRSQKEQARILSRIEREAWAYGLVLLRKLRDEAGLRIDDIFSDFEEMKSFVDGNLAAYRKNFEKMFLAEFDREFYEKFKNEELKKLFDRR